MNAYPSAAEIDRLLSYDPNTGEFRWKARPDDAAFTTRRGLFAEKSDAMAAYAKAAALHFGQFARAA